MAIGICATYRGGIMMTSIKNSSFDRQSDRPRMRVAGVDRVESVTILYSIGSNRFPPFPGLIFILVLFLCPAHGQQSPADAVIHREDGQIRTVIVHAANNNGVMWSNREAPNPQLMPFDEIAKVDFPEPDLWKQGNDYFYRGDFQKAIAAFSSLASNPRGHFHPTPGNYSSLGRLRLIECLRETGDVAAIAKAADGLAAESLPKSQRSRMAVISAWAELGRNNWEEALAKAEAIEANPIAPDRNDLGFIKAMALENTGNPTEAIIAYGNAYTVDFGASRELAGRAMKNAILLLIALDSENREGELHSLVHTYAKVYNKGKLWEGAPARAVELLEKGLELTEMQAEPEAEEEPDSETGEPMEKSEEADTKAKPEQVGAEAKPEAKPEAAEPKPKPLSKAQKRRQAAKDRAEAKAKAAAKAADPQPADQAE